MSGPANHAESSGVEGNNWNGVVHDMQTRDTERVSAADDSMPDLIVEDMYYGSCVPFESRAPFIVVVKNIGTAAAESSTTEILNVSQGWTQDVSTSALQPGQSTNVWMDNAFFDGDTTASADSGGVVPESDENNNSLTKHVIRPACGTPTMSPTPTATDTATPMPVHTVSGTAYEFPGCMGYMRGWNVVLSPLGWQTQTSIADGSFAFYNVPNGSYSVEMSPPCNPYGCWDDVPVTVAGVDRTGLQICPHGPVATSTPTPTPTDTLALSYQSNASPPSGTYVDPTAAPTFSYSLVISNVGQTAVTPLIVHFDLIDVAGPPTVFSSTQGTCAWSDQPDYYHGASTGECDLGTLPPAGGSPSSATVNLNGTIFWNFYSHEYAHVAVSVNGTPVAGITYPFGTPTPTGTPIAGSTPDPPSVGGIAEPPDDFTATHEGSGLPVGEIAMMAGVAVVVATAGGWYARRRFGCQRR